MRKRYTAQEKLDLVQQFKESRLSFTQFSNLYHINYQTLRHWCIADTSINTDNIPCSTKEVGFVEVKRSYFRQDTSVSKSISIKKAGMEITIPLDSNLSEMKTVFEALSAL